MSLWISGVRLSLQLHVVLSAAPHSIHLPTLGAAAPGSSESKVQKLFKQLQIEQGASRDLEKFQSTHTPRPRWNQLRAAATLPSLVDAAVPSQRKAEGLDDRYCITRLTRPSSPSHTPRPSAQIGV